MGQATTRGRRPATLRPPRVGVSSRTGGIRLSALDLQWIARRSGLLVVIDGDALWAETNRIQSALHDYVVERRSRIGGRSVTEIEPWASSLKRWASEGIEALGADSSSKFPAWSNHAEQGDALTHLMLGWPVEFTHKDGEVTEPRKTLAELRLLLRTANAGPDGRDDYQATKALVEQTISGLAALRLLAEGLAHWGKRQPMPTKTNMPSVILFRNLAQIYEELHGKSYQVNIKQKTDVPLNSRASAPYGPALTWTRCLFAIFAYRAKKIADAIDAFPEFVELAEWSLKSDALRNRINQTSKWLSEVRPGVLQALTGGQR